ncbi:hypothetical protein DB346_21765 [Verrucomicrobia bacterium LW23]|nr:hypothetical protein DB346_21765 [Verrucomicrobia bacterium LW23]
MNAFALILAVAALIGAGFLALVLLTRRSSSAMDMRPGSGVDAVPSGDRTAAPLPGSAPRSAMGAGSAATATSAPSSIAPGGPEIFWHERFQAVRNEAARGNKITAIADYRRIAGVSLLDAKLAVEMLMSKMPGQPQPPAAPTPALDASDPLYPVHDEIAKGSKIGAISHYRRITGVSLAQAKQAVEAMMEGSRSPTDATSPQSAVSAAEAAADGLPEHALAEIRTLLSRGDKIGAIRLFRTHTSSGLAEAKNAVEAIHAAL